MESLLFYKGLLIMVAKSIKATCEAEGIAEKGSRAYQQFCKELRFRLRVEEAAVFDEALDELARAARPKEGE